jgi:hypothetical protein
MCLLALCIFSLNLKIGLFILYYWIIRFIYIFQICHLSNMICKYFLSFWKLPFVLALLSGIWSQAPVLARQGIFHKSCPSPLDFSNFSDRVSHLLPGLALDSDPPTYTFCIARIIGMYHHTKLVCWKGVSLAFLPGLTLNWSLNHQSDLPDLHLPNSWDYRHGPSHPVPFLLSWCYTLNLKSLVYHLRKHYQIKCYRTIPVFLKEFLGLTEWLKW